MNRDTSASTSDWEIALDRILPLFGHRNWIVIADAAYPAQSNPGIETLVTGTDHLAVLNKVLAGISSCRHVRARIYTDAELKLVSDDDAPGATQLRAKLDELLAKYERRELPHEQIISKLDEAGTLFRVLILKSNLCIPYTSVFLELDCGYWDGDAERRLRAQLADSQQN